MPLIKTFTYFEYHRANKKRYHDIIRTAKSDFFNSHLYRKAKHQINCLNCIRDKLFIFNVELIDVQTLLPFDINEIIVESVKKTSRVLFFDEDVPGGATAFMIQKVVEEQGAYRYLDSPPQTLSAMEHWPAYTTDGDYFSNPHAENVFETVYGIMHEVNPRKYPELY